MAERDALSERIRVKDKEKTRHVLERSDKKVHVRVCMRSGFECNLYMKSTWQCITLAYIMFCSLRCVYEFTVFIHVQRKWNTVFE